METGAAGAFWQICLQWIRDSRAPLAVSGLALLIYTRSLFCGFVRDDLPQIVHNPQVQSWAYLPHLLGSHLWSQSPDEPAHFYRPLFSVWMLLVNTFGGLAPWAWHLSSLGLHVVAIFLVFRLCRRLTGSEAAATAAAAVFAVDPIHVDAVTWISASCEVLFAIFALAATLAALGPENSGDEPSSRPRVWWSAAWCAAGILAKETGMVMLVILPVVAWIRSKDSASSRNRIWRATYPFAAVTAGYLLVRWTAMHRIGVEAGEHSWAQVGFSAPSILIFYWKKLLVPWNLSGSYVNPLVAWPTTEFWITLGVVGIGLAVAAWVAIRSRPAFGLAVALIVVPILPALAVIRIYQQGDMTHDRYLYLPSAGLALLVAIFVHKAWPLPKAARVAAIAAVSAVFVAYSAGTLSQQRYYQDDVAFYSRVIQVSPSDGFAMGMLGNVYLDQGRNDLALDQFQRAHQIEAGNAKITFFLARGLFVTGQLDSAERVLNDLLQTPQLTAERRESTLVSLANVEISLGNLDYARQLLEQASHHDDRFPQLHWALGVLYQREGLLPQALAEYEKEFEISGDTLARQRSAFLARLIHSQEPASLPRGGGR